MELSRGQRRALVIATLAPFAYAPLLLTASAIAGVAAAGLQQPSMTPASYVYFAMIALFPLVLIDMLALTVVYSLLAIRATEGDASRRALWLAAILFLGILGQSFFYLTEIPSKPKPTQLASGAGSDSFNGWRS